MITQFENHPNRMFAKRNDFSWFKRVLFTFARSKFDSVPRKQGKRIVLHVCPFKWRPTLTCNRNNGKMQKIIIQM